jgi:hypothetical protein
MDAEVRAADPEHPARRGPGARRRRGRVTARTGRSDRRDPDEAKQAIPTRDHDCVTT